MSDYKITIAKSAGFCPGVKNAIERVLQLSDKGKKPVYTVGPLIHNKQVTQMLEKKDIFTINNLNEAADKNGAQTVAVFTCRAAQHNKEREETS